MIKVHALCIGKYNFYMLFCFASIKGIRLGEIFEKKEGKEEGCPAGQEEEDKPEER